MAGCLNSIRKIHKTEKDGKLHWCPSNTCLLCLPDYPSKKNAPTLWILSLLQFYFLNFFFFKNQYAYAYYCLENNSEPDDLVF